MGNNHSGSNRNRPRIILTGLDAAGKTTIIYALGLHENLTAPLTFTSILEQTRWNNYDIVIWDEGGQEKLQPLYRHYYPGSKAIIFVVDSWDKNRMDQAKIELHKLLCKPELKDVIVLILANKQDQPNALSGDQVQDGLGMTYYVSQSPELLKSLAEETLLKMLPDDVIEIVSSYTPHRLCRPWNKYVGVGTQTKCAVFETSATAKTGLNEGLEWLATQLDNSKQNNCIIL